MALREVVIGAVTFALFSLNASAQRSGQDALVSAIANAGYGECLPDFENYFGTPDGARLTTPPSASGTYRLCFKGDLEQVWQVAPTIGGPGINSERAIQVQGRKNHGTDTMWVVPGQAYDAHDLYFPGRTQRSGGIMVASNEFVEWKDIGATLPFIPGRVIYFGDHRGVAYVGFTDLNPLPGMQALIAPLTRNSVVVGIDGMQFPTSQAYIKYLNSRLNAGYPRNSEWQGGERFVEVAYYPSPDVVNDVPTMRKHARVAYLPIFLVRDNLDAWDVAVSTPSARSLSLGATGSYAMSIFGPLAGFRSVMGAAGYDEEEYQRRKQECREAGGLC